MNEIEKVIHAQRKYFGTNETKNVDFRIKQLVKFKNILKTNEPLLFKAIYKDFNKSEFETYITELALLYHEINKCIKNIKKWSKEKKVSTGLTNFPAKSYIVPEPLGNTLIIGPWNYPYQLSLIPAISSIAAGNTVLLKPSELPSQTSSVMAKLINDNFPAEFIHVVEGGVEVATNLLEYRFDKIFFTGSIPVGKIVYKAAAENLTPVTLELGGKSPTFVLSDANIEVAAKRIIWAKFINAGQTCVAPDFILVDKSIEDKLINALISEVKNYPQSYNPDAENYLQIINTTNFDRLNNLIDDDKICFGGNRNKVDRFISPTLMKNVSFNDPIMEEEIFGPILPVISFTDLDSAVKEVKARPKPLACYIYSNDKKSINKILTEISFGGGTINDSLMHFTNSNLPFGGVGFSGIGSYHGKAGFDTFSHFKSILHKRTWFEPNIKFTPYSNTKKRIIKLLVE